MLHASLSKRGNTALAAGFRCSLFGRGNEPYGSTSTAHQKQTYTNKQSGSKLEGGAVEEKGKDGAQKWNVFLFSCSTNGSYFHLLSSRRADIARDMAIKAHLEPTVF